MEKSIPSMPSFIGRPPDPPHSGWITLTLLCPVSGSGTRSKKIDPCPAPAAGTVSGRACASAPMMTSTSRICVAERLPTDTPGSGFSRQPRGISRLTGRARPELYVMPARTDRRKPTREKTNCQWPRRECDGRLYDWRVCGSVSEKSSVTLPSWTIIRTFMRMARPPPESPSI